MSKNDLYNLMQEESESGHVAYTNFVTAYSKKYPELIYCFFEGNEDVNYYGTRITIKYGKKFEDFTCGGRDLVLQARELIESRPEYNNAKVLFFIDKDYTDDEINETIYVTPCYSIENLYSSSDTLKMILQGVFKMNDRDENYNKILQLYEDSLIIYHQKILFLNAWLACQHDIRIETRASVRLNINEVLKDYFRNDTNMFETSLNLKQDIFDNLQNKEILENNLFINAPKIDESKINGKIDYFNNVDKSYMFRGKFELKFFIDFLKRLKEDATSKNPKVLTSKYKCDVSFKLEDSILVLTQYSNTPDCLIEFLNKHLIK